MKYSAIMACLNLKKKPNTMPESVPEQKKGNVKNAWKDRLKHRIHGRKYWCMAALLIFLLEMALLVWPVGWLREDVSNCLTGEGSWNMERQEGNFACRQTFRPENNNLESIGIVISSDEELSGGNAVIVISDTKNKVLFETRIPYENATLDAYTDIEIEPALNQAARTCYLSVYLEADGNGTVPVMMATSTSYHMPENIALEQEKKLQDAQLVTRYYYANVIPREKLLQAFCICGVTALGIAIGLPRDRRFRKFLGVILLAAIPWILGRRMELLTINTDFMLPFSMKWNMALMYLLELILLLCTQSFRASICISSLTLTLLYTANCYVFSFRGEPLRLNDFSAVRTAAKVIGHYDLRPNNYLAMAWCIAFFFLCSAHRQVFGGKQRIRSEKRRRV